MAVTKQQKAEILAELTEKFKNAKSIGFAATNTLTVSEFGELRNNLRTVDASYTLAKKTLIKKALKDAIGVDIELSMLEGQIGVVCSNEDAIAGLSKVNDLVKSSKGEKINWAASIIDGELKELEETQVIASMPSRDTLLGRLVGSMKSPISAMARFLDAAVKEVETQGKDSLGKIEAGGAPAPKVEETPVKEEKKEEEAEEAKTEENTQEAPTEEKAEEVVKEEAATEVADEAPKTEETPVEEEKKEEPKAE